MLLPPARHDFAEASAWYVVTPEPSVVPFSARRTVEIEWDDDDTFVPPRLEAYHGDIDVV